MLTDDARARVAAMLEEMADLPGFYDRGPLAVNTAGFGGDTPLIVALIRSDLQAALDLLAAGADPSAVGEDDFSALHWAATRGPEFVRPLLAGGAVSTGRNLFGETPQDIARRSGDPALVALLGDP